MSIVTRDATTDHTNYLQFMQHCINEGLSYEEYRQSADACGKFIDTEAAYGRMVLNMLAEADHWNSIADEVGA